MKKLLILLLSVLMMLCFVACGQDDNSATQTQETQSTQPSTETSTTHGEIVNEDGSVNYGYEFFEPTGKVYEAGSLIDKFPLLNAEDEFWTKVSFAVYPTEDCKLEILSEHPTYLTWDEIKEITVDNMSSLILGGDDNVLIPINVHFIEEDATKTWYEIVKNRGWWGNGFANKQKRIDFLFPIKADSIAEMIIANYGQPSEIDPEFMSGVYRIEYYIMNRSITMNISENMSQDDGELPYKIEIFIRLHEE